jgi:hypothetical protein
MFHDQGWKSTLGGRRRSRSAKKKNFKQIGSFITAAATF